MVNPWTPMSERHWSMVTRHRPIRTICSFSTNSVCFSIWCSHWEPNITPSRRSSVLNEAKYLRCKFNGRYATARGHGQWAWPVWCNFRPRISHRHACKPFKERVNSSPSLSWAIQSNYSHTLYSIEVQSTHFDNSNTLVQHANMALA